MQTVGIISINKSYHNNMLDRVFMFKLRKVLSEFEHNEEVPYLILKSLNPEVFSMGTPINCNYFI